jgi:predicted RNA-binding protein with PIN domain
MPYLLDGNNLMGLARQRGLSGLADRRGLVAAVGALARAKGGRYTVVFDGGPDAHFTGATGLGAVQVEFAAPQSADGRIVARVRAAANPRNLTAVTADRTLAAAARQFGARVMDAAEFLHRLLGSAGGPDGDKPDPRQVDVTEWEDYFRGGSGEEGE